MKFPILLVAMIALFVTDSTAQEKTIKADQKNTAVEVASKKAYSSKELRKVEKPETDQAATIAKIKMKIEELEYHIEKASENPDYNIDAANARLHRLREELAKRENPKK